MACMGLTGAFRTTPTFTMKTMLCILRSTYIYIKGVVRMTTKRLRAANMWKGNGEKIGQWRIINWASRFKHDTFDQKALSYIFKVFPEYDKNVSAYKNINLRLVNVVEHVYVLKN